MTEHIPDPGCVKRALYRAGLATPGDAEAQEGYLAYGRGAPATSNPYHPERAEEDHRGWSKGWWLAHWEAEGRT